uniref:Protein FAR1-RELATED SEQUENCE 5 n=1 Tax=Cajanus cajan TaxID=3821 RepID=A0A151TB80_CAJCA|nr:Protein FAR1-RELATED SEQUENCE 5 [Cajanus cajan]
MRQFLCNKASLRDKKHFIRDDRKKQHRPLTQTNCKAKLRVRLDEKIGKWKVVSFEASHNHIRSEDKYVSLIPTYHGLSTAEKAQVDSLHAQGKRTCHIMGFMMEQKWGCVGLGFNKKDVYNHISQQRRFKPTIMRISGDFFGLNFYEFGYDPSEQNYVVVQIHLSKCDPSHRAFVYSLNGASWRDFEDESLKTIT